MSSNLSAIFYLISGVLFILALRGLSSPETSRRGNFFGILGMAIAIIVTFLSIENFSSGFIYVLILLLVGGSFGAFIAFKIPMTAMPELVAGFHSLVGLAAVFVAISAFATAQTADEILNRLSEQSKEYNTIEATYSSILVDLKNNFTEEMYGRILINGNNFNLDIGDYVISSDGVTVWTYDKEANECYIDDAEMLIEEGMDPSKIFTIWEDDFKTELKGSTVDSEGIECKQINLYPNNTEEKTYHTIQLFVKGDVDYEVVKMIVKGREGNDTEYNIGSFKTNVTIPVGSFKFDQQNFPGVELIDNRI